MGDKKLLHIFSAPQSVYYFMEGQLQFMIKNGFEVHVALPLDDYYAPAVLARDPNVIFHYVPMERKISLFKDLKCFFIIKRLIKEINPDIIHLHTPKASFLGAVASKLSGHKNVIYQMHGLVSTDGFKVQKGLIYYLEKYTCSFSLEVFAVSNSLRSYAIENGYCDAGKIKVIGNGTINGIEFEYKFNPNRLKFLNVEFDRKKFKGKFILGFVGRICRDKGVFDFLQLIENVKERIPVLGIMVGPLEMGEEFQKYLDEKKLKDVIKVFGETQQPEKFLAQFDLLLFPTKREGFGLVAAEANALNVPVIAYDIPGVKDAVENNVTGKLVSYGSIEETVKAVEEYYFNPIERELHGVSGRERVKQLFNRSDLWREILSNYVRIIDSAG